MFQVITNQFYLTLPKPNMCAGLSLLREFHTGLGNLINLPPPLSTGTAPTCDFGSTLTSTGTKGENSNALQHFCLPVLLLWCDEN